LNWFRKNSDGKFLWPGFGDNKPVIEWMCDRVDGKAEGRKTPIGYLPNSSDLDLRGLNVAPENINELLRVDAEAWKLEIPRWRNFSRNSAKKTAAKIKATSSQS